MFIDGSKKELLLQINGFAFLGLQLISRCWPFPEPRICLLRLIRRACATSAACFVNRPTLKLMQYYLQNQPRTSTAQKIPNPKRLLNERCGSLNTMTGTPVNGLIRIYCLIQRSDCNDNVHLLWNNIVTLKVKVIIVRQELKLD
jgi:hypothetical protein